MSDPGGPAGTTPAAPHRPPRRALGAFLAILQGMARGAIEVTVPDGRRFRVAGAEPGPVGRLVVRHPDFFRRLISEGELSFGEMYVERWWTTPDLQDLLDVVLLNNREVARGFPGLGLYRAWGRLRQGLKGNSRRRAAHNIAYHYDLGNAFYGAWLDETMTYSSALYRTGREQLRTAQRNKYAAICAHLAPAPGDTILEIGCGWGGFAEFAMRECGVRVTGLTISREQLAYAQRRLYEVGLAERAEIVLRDYRDERGTYDHIVSIEMIEAVGEANWPAYFATLRDRLRPGGVAALQAITIDDRLFPQYRRGTDFMQKYIFPGGLLPCRGALLDRAAAAGLARVGEEAFADSYVRTLRTWRRRFNAGWSRIAALGFDDRFRRMWNFYLAASAAGFAAGTTDVVQIAWRRGG